MILLPGTHHYITWTKQNLLDSATYYPQAVIKDKRTDTTLDTLNLASLGSDRYGTSWLVPQDPTGQGREVSIVITVYEDSGYSVVSGMYGAWETDYLIYSLKQQGSGGGGTSVPVDYKHIRDSVKNVIEEEIKKIPKPEKLDLSEVLGGIGDVKQGLGDKVKELLRLGKKAESLVEAEKRVELLLSKLELAVNTSKKDISELVNNASFSIEGIVKESIEQLNKASGEHNKVVAKQTEKEIQSMERSFKKVVAEQVNEFNKKLVESVDRSLSKPVEVQLVRESSEKKEDDRVNKIMKYIGA